MGLHRFRPPLSGRMGTLRTLGTIRGAALIEYGCMGHMLYSRVFLNQAGVADGCRLYSTHIDETDISMGDTKRLNRTIAEIVEKDKPEIIFFLPSSVPTVIGTDLDAICKELQPEYPDIPLLPFGAGGFHVHGYEGVEEALLLLAKELPKEREKTSNPTFNIIGSCADMFRFQADAEEMVRILKGAFNMDPVCVMTSHTSASQIMDMAGSHINIVVRREGEKAAKYLEKRYGTPYVTGRPYGIEGTLSWIENISNTLGVEADRDFVNQEVNSARNHLRPAMPVLNHMIRSHPDEATISLGGHADVVKGILEYGHKELSLYRGDCWCDSPDMGDEDIPYFTEEEWSKAVRNRKKGIFMGSGEALKWAGKGLELQISNPDVRWRLSPYDPPLVGFHGAIHLAGLWLNALLEQEEEEE